MEKISATETVPPNSGFVEGGKKQLESLQETNLAAVDLQFSAEEKQCLSQIQISNNTNFDIYDIGEENFLLALKAKLEEIGLNEPNLVSELAKIITSRAEGFRAMMSKEALSVTVRVTLPHSYNDIPRWHDDGSYFAREADEKVYKMVFSLVGAGTLFGQVLDKEKYTTLHAESDKNYQSNSGTLISGRRRI